jgi:predicted transglutaminase-like cysteine proteinase
MRGVVKSRVAAGAVVAMGIIAIVAVQPAADAALSTYSSAVAPEADSFHVVNSNPYPSALAGILQPSGIEPLTVLSPVWPEQPLAMIAPELAHPFVAPEPSVIVPELAQPAILPEPMPSVGTLDKAPPTIDPDTAQREAFAAPGELMPQEPRKVPSRRQAARTQPRADVLQIRFEGPAGAPFAHTRFCIKYPSECRVHKMLFRGGAIELTAARRQELIRINAEVNRSIVATNMNEPVAEEQWVIQPKAGDCNDYAVTKRHKLIARGWPARALLLAEVVTNWGEHHLVLVVRTRQGDFVADNLAANIRNWTKAPYEWVRVESPANPMFWSKIRAPQPEAVAMAAHDPQL